MRDPRGRISRYTYDGAGNVLTKTDPLGRVTANTYDTAGDLTSTVKPSGTATTDDPTDATITFAYDAAHRVAGVSYSDDTPSTTYAWALPPVRGHGAFAVVRAYRRLGNDDLGMVCKGSAPMRVRRGLRLSFVGPG